MTAIEDVYHYNAQLLNPAALLRRTIQRVERHYCGPVRKGDGTLECLRSAYRRVWVDTALEQYEHSADRFTRLLSQAGL